MYNYVKEFRSEEGDVLDKFTNTHTGAYYKYKSDNKYYLVLGNADSSKKVFCLPLMKNYKGNLNNYKIMNPLSNGEHIIISMLNIFKTSDLENPLLKKDKKVFTLEKKEMDKIFYQLWQKQINILDRNYIKKDRLESLKFSIWLNKKYDYSYKQKKNEKLLDGDGNVMIKSKAVYWVDFGHNIGSEQRKMRPAIIWKRFGCHDFICIPISTKFNGNYFHIKLECILGSYAYLEHIKYVSVKRIVKPYFDKSRRILKVSDNDYHDIRGGLKRFYSL